MKTVSKVLAIATLATGLNMANVPQANAALVMSFASPAVGLVLAFAGGSMYAKAKDKQSARAGIKLFLLNERTSEVEFLTVDPKTAAEIGLSEEEYDSYNSEIDRVNATMDEVDSDLRNAPRNELEDIENKSLAKFEEQISPAAFSALKKIVKASI